MVKNLKVSTFFKNFFYISVGNMTSQILSFAISVYIANVFGPEKFGVINSVNIIVMYFFYAAGLGLYGLGVIEVNKHKKSLKGIVDSIVSLRIVLALLVFLLLVVLAVFIPKDGTFKIMLLLNGLTILASSFYIDWLFNGLQDMKYTSISVIIKNLTYCILVGGILLSGISNSIYVVPFSMAVAALLSSIYLFYAYFRKYRVKFNFIFDLGKYKELASNSWPFLFNGVFALINLNMDTLMLFIMKGDYEVGLYTSVYRIASALMLIISFVFIPVYPMLIQNYNDKKYETLTLIVNKLRKLMITLCIPLTIGAFVLNKETMSTLYKDDYAKATNTFTILILYVALLCIREVYGYELNAWGMQKKYMKAVMVSAIYNIVGNVILIPFLGIEGAAINTLISEVINYLMMKRFSENTLKIKYDNSYILKIILSSAVVLVTVYLMKQVTLNAIIIALVSGFVYSIAVFATKAFTLGEIKSILLKK